jgi:GDPmannose 4,6-dehydratase
LEARRDWGHAKDTANAMKLILEHHSPDDFVIATGESHSIKEFLTEAFSLCNLDWKDYVIINEKYFRPSEVDHLRGDSSKAKKLLNWEPTYTFKQLVKEMVDYDLELARKEKNLLL